MPEMPSLGAPPKSSTPVIPVVIAAIVAGLALGGLFWIRQAPSTDATPASTPPVAEAVPAPVLADGTAPVVAEQAPVVAAPVAVAPAAPGMKAFTVAITGPLESAIVTSEGKEVGTALTQVVNRSLVWWLRVPQDLVKGDTLSVVYEARDHQEPLVHAVRFTSLKLGKTFESYRFKADADAFAHFYQADGSALEERLVDSPVEGYEQITSLLRDGRKHKGVDFKTPVGTPVKATFDSVVERKNWNFRGNGNSVELREVGGQGRTAMFLHLSELPKTLVPGQRIKRGEVFAKSGNTGHSFAPHLHYQLMKNDNPIDPFDSQATSREKLAATQVPAFEKQMNELKALFPAGAIAAAATR